MFRKKKSLQSLCIPLFALILTFPFSSCKQNTSNLKEETQDVQYIIDSAGSILSSGEIFRAKQYVDKAFSEVKNQTTLTRWKRFSFLANFYLNYKVNLYQASQYADSMLVVSSANKMQMKYEYASSLFTGGDILAAKKNYKKAFGFYFKGRDFSIRYLDKCSLAGIENRIALLYFRQENYEMAISSLNKSLKENSLCPEKNFRTEVSFIQGANNSLGLCYQALGQYDRAIHYFNRALRVINTGEKKYRSEPKFIASARGVIYGNLGGVLSLKNQRSDAEHYLRLSIVINDREGYALDDAQTAKLKLATLYLQNSQFQKTERLIKQVEQYEFNSAGKSLANEKLRLRIQQIKAQYAAKTGNYKQANNLLKSYFESKDSISKSIEFSRLNNFDREIENVYKEYRIKFLNQQSKSKTYVLIGTIGLSLLIFIILILLWKSLKDTRGYIGRMKSLNEKIRDRNIQLSETLDALKQSQEENSKLLLTIAHDLRNPLSSMIMAAGVLKRRVQPQEPELRMLQLIEDSGGKAITLIEDLLNSDHPSTALEKHEVDIHDILFYCIKMISHKAEEKLQNIVLDSEHVTVNLNREKIWRVVSNLLANAVKFSPEKSSIEVGAKKENSHLTIWVRDYGIGIPKELQAGIFVRNSPSSRAGTSGEKSYGLGLSITKQIVEAHGGKIWFENNEKAGVTFMFNLPL